MSPSGFIPRALLWNVALMARIVPAHRRAAWAAEWRAEFGARFRSTHELRTGEFLSLAYGMTRDAAGLRVGDVDEWSADVRSAARAIACNRLSAACAVGLTTLTVVPLVALVFTGTRAISILVRREADGSHALTAGVALVGVLCAWGLLWLGARAVSAAMSPLAQAMHVDRARQRLVCPLLVLAAAPGSLVAAVWAAARVHTSFVNAAGAGAYGASPQATLSLVACVASALLLALSIVTDGRLSTLSTPSDALAPWRRFVEQRGGLVESP